MTETELYVFEKECKNCKRINKIRIPKGILVKDFLKEEKKCFNCGCKLEVEE